MYIYNITFHVASEIEDKWLKFLKEQFIPQMLSSGILYSALTSKVITNDNTGNSYSVQFKTTDKNTLNKFLEEEFEPIIEQINRKFAPKMVFFATELDVLDETINKNANE